MKTKMPRFLRWGIVIFFVLNCSVANISIAGTFSVRTIALSATDGEFGPGLGAGATFTGFDGWPLINSVGDVSFPGTVSFPAGGTKRSLWVSRNAPSVPVAMGNDDGSLGPNLGTGIVYSYVGKTVFLGDGGDYLLGGTISGDSINRDNNRFVIQHSSGENTLIARSGVGGTLGPGVEDGTVFKYLGTPSLSPDNTVILPATLIGPAVDDSNDTGIWRYSNDGQQLLFRTGATGISGPGIGDDSLFVDDVSPFPPQIASDSGEVVLLARAKKSSTSPLEFGIWRNTNGTNVPAMLSGEEGLLGPGLGVGVSYSVASIEYPYGLKYDTNAQGDILFSAELNDGRNGFWKNLGNENVTIALTGETGPLGPGLGPSVAFTDLTSNFLAVPTINENGVSIFRGQLEGQIGLWLNDAGVNQAIALTGQDDSLGPGLGAGVKFSGFNEVVINNNDTVFFTANISPGVPANRNLGLWAYQNGEITKIASYGEMFDVDPTAGIDERAIRFVTIPYAQQVDSDGATVNDHDEVVVKIGFQDGTYGVFAVRLIPEPSSLLLACLAGVLFCSRRRIR